jgi:uncharacterized cofD-like protein
VTLVASVNGHMVEGESRIPLQNAPISRIFLRARADRPPALETSCIELNPEAAVAIKNAEMIVAGPGSLYTSILPNLLVPGMVEAIKESPALKVFVSKRGLPAWRDRWRQRQRLPASARAARVDS